MLYRSLIIPIVLVVALCVTIADARAADDPRYPAWSGGWARRSAETADPLASRWPGWPCLPPTVHRRAAR